MKNLVLAVIQARSSSSRFPNKVLRPLLGIPMIFRQMERVCHSELINKVVIATSDNADDDILSEEINKMGYSSYRGSLNDVLLRIFMAATQFKPKHVVRITADCPLIDYKVIDQVIAAHIESDADYTSNVAPPTFPDGLDVEVIKYDVLKNINQEAMSVSDREHVTQYIRLNPSQYKTTNVESEVDYSKMRWTVDNIEDFQFVETIYNGLYNKDRYFTSDDIRKFLKKNPEVVMVNKKYKRNYGSI